MTRGPWADAVLFVLILLVAGWWGKHCVDAFSASGRTPGMYNELFEPAVMTACGRGFHRSVEPPAALMRFLTRADDRFSCSALPADLKIQEGLVSEGSWLYLLLLVASAWRALGISWSGLSPLLGLFFGLTSAFGYVVFRFGMGRVGATLCAAALSLSTLQLLNLPGFRDYTKAPIMLALLAIALALGLLPLRSRALIALCAAYGALVGVGYGLKPDTLIQIPVLVVTVMLFLPGGVTANAATKVAGLAAAAAAVAVTMWPVVRATPATGNNLWHIAIIGFMPEYDQALGVDNPVYRCGVTASDEYVYLSTGSYVARTHPDWPEPVMYTKAYERATRAYLLELASRFPADIVTRGVSSISRIPEIPFGWPQPPLPGLLDRVYAVRERVLTPLYGYGLPLTLASLAAITLVRPREGLFLSFLFAYLGAYPTIQFHNRNFFHLEAIGWLVVGFVFSQVFAAVIGRGAVFGGISRRDVLKRVAVGVVAIVLGVGVLLGLRSYQTQLLRRTINGYLRASIHPLRLEQTDSETTHRAAIPAVAAQSRDPHWARLIRVEVSAAACGGGTLTYQYDPGSPYRRLSATIALPRAAAGGTGRLIAFEPVYSGFASVDLHGAGGGCLQSVSQVTGLDDEPLWVPLVLDANWRTAPLYQWIQTRENIH